VNRTFCGRCGTPLTYQKVDSPQTIDVTTVSLDRPDACAPTKEIWVEERIAWEPLSDSLPHYLRSSAGNQPVHVPA
jgi:hypothetical protein